MREATAAKIERLKRALDVPMTVLSLIMVAIIVLQLTGELAPPYDRWAETLSLAIWSVFALEFLIKLWLAPSQRAYLSANWLDVLILVLPVLRGLRILRVLSLTRGYHGLRFAAWLLRSSREVQEITRQSHLGYLLGLSSAVSLAAALMVWWLEADVAGSPLRTYGTSLWWSSTLITTINVGADPVTVPGRVIALLMRLYGLSVFVYLVSSLTAYWFGQPAAPETIETSAPEGERPDA